jgi:hypothetical protein
MIQSLCAVPSIYISFSGSRIPDTLIDPVYLTLTSPANIGSATDIMSLNRIKAIANNMIYQSINQTAINLPINDTMTNQTDLYQPLEAPKPVILRNITLSNGWVITELEAAYIISLGDFISCISFILFGLYLKRVKRRVARELEERNTYTSHFSIMVENLPRFAFIFVFLKQNLHKCRLYFCHQIKNLQKPNQNLNKVVN